MTETDSITLTLIGQGSRDGPQWGAFWIGTAVGTLIRKGWKLESRQWEFPRWYKPWTWWRSRFTAVLSCRGEADLGWKRGEP